MQNIVGSICVATFRRRWKLPCSTRRPSKAIPGRPWLRNDMDRASVIIHHHFREKNSAEVRLSSSMRIPVTLTSAHIIYCSRSILFLEDSGSDHLYRYLTGYNITAKSFRVLVTRWQSFLHPIEHLCKRVCVLLAHCQGTGTHAVLLTEVE